MTSKPTSPTLLKRIDEFLIRSYPHLQNGDEVYYIGEYTPGEKPNYSEMNQLILNYKKPISRRGEPDWPYKERSIQQAARLLRSAISQTPTIANREKEALLVPIPPSTSRDIPEYDDRNSKLLNYFAPRGNVQEFLLQKQSRASLHSSKHRDPKKIEENYFLAKLAPVRREVWLFDDVLTQGTTFRAASNAIKSAFPDLKIVGFVIARSVYSTH